jgi:hypothetical protein
MTPTSEGHPIAACWQPIISVIARAAVTRAIKITLGVLLRDPCCCANGMVGFPPLPAFVCNQTVALHK